jgi:hypothetical protein
VHALEIWRKDRDCQVCQVAGRPVIKVTFEQKAKEAREGPTWPSGGAVWL